MVRLHNRCLQRLMMGYLRWDHITETDVQKTAKPLNMRSLSLPWVDAEGC